MMSFCFGDHDQEGTASEDFAVFLGQITHSDGESEGVSSFLACPEDRLLHTQEYDHHSSEKVNLENAQAIMMTSSASQPLQPPLEIITPERAPFPIDGHHQCVHQSQLIGDKNCSLKGAGKLRKGGGHETSEKRRVRGPDWRVEEKRAYLKLKVEALRSVKGKDWDFISHNLEKRHGFKRSAKCCEDLWGTLRKAFRAIRDHENNPQIRNLVSYWEMDADGRARNELPKSFPEDCFVDMESILAAQEQRPGKKSSCKDNSTPADQEDDDQLHCTEDGSMNLVGDVVDSALQRLGNIREEDDALFAMFSTLLKQRMEDAVNSAVIAANFGPRLVNLRWMMDVLDSSLVMPVASALRAVRSPREVEDEARLKAIQETRRALDREERQIKRQRLGRVHQRKPSKHQRKKGSHAEGTLALE